MEANLTGALVETEEMEVGYHHRRAFSDYSLHVENNFNDLLLQPLDFDITDFPFPPPPPPPATSCGGSSSEPVEQHVQSLFVESHHLDKIGMAGDLADEEGGGEKVVEPHRHRYSKSVDGSSTGSSTVGKKAMTAEKLAELAKVDPKKAKRILANRQSAAKSKERKMRYAIELEKTVQELQIESDKVNAKVSKLEKSTTDLAAENRELKIHTEAMRQQANVRRALNQKMKEEVYSLRIETDQYSAITGIPTYAWLHYQFSSQLTVQQFPNPQFHHQAPQPPQLSMPPPPPFGQPFDDHCGPSFSNYIHPN